MLMILKNLQTPGSASWQPGYAEWCIAKPAVNPVAYWSVRVSADGAKLWENHFPSKPNSI